MNRQRISTEKLLFILKELKNYRYSIIFILFINVICYSYLFTEHIFTNHTLPEIFHKSFPSYYSTVYGRWMADIITTLLGGVGIQPVGMLITTLLIIAGTLIIIRTFGINEKKWFVLIGLILTLAPERFDMLTFSMGLNVFFAAILFILLGIYFFVKGLSFLKRSIIPTIFFISALACTQTNLPLLLLFIGFGLIIKWLFLDENDATINSILTDVLIAIFNLLLAVSLYFLSYRLIAIVAYHGSRLEYRNSLVEIISQTKNSYPIIWEYFTTPFSYLPKGLNALPMVLIAIAFVVILFCLYKKHWLMVLFSFLILTLTPIFLNTIYIINNQSGGGGRFLIQYSYLLILCILIIVKGIDFLKNPKSRIWTHRFIILSSIIIIYFTAILSLQRTNYYYHKGKQEELLVQRVLTRIESKVPNLYSNKYSLIVVGHPMILNAQQFMMQNLQKVPHAHFSSYMFELYRQPEILNYFLGYPTFKYPSKADLEMVKPLIKSAEIWPNESAIFVKDNIVVVVFEKYHIGIKVTQIRE